MAWVVLVTVAIVIGTTLVNNALDRESIEQVSAKNFQSEFLATAQMVGRFLGRSDDLHNVALLEKVLKDIITLHPNVGVLSLYESVPESSARIYSSDPDSAPARLSEYERTETAAGRLVFHRYDETTDRGWIVTAPVVVNGKVIAALRGRYSLQPYDELLLAEGRSAKVVGLTAVVLSSLILTWLIRSKVQKPIRELIEMMGQAEARNLTSHLHARGPADIQELARQFNQMLDRIRSGLIDRERLHGEIKGFNEKLIRTVAETRGELDRTSQQLVESRITAERASKLAALGELSALVAHELGNPMNAISGHLQLLEKELRSQEPNRHLTIVRTEIERMVSIIRQILDSTSMVVRSGPVDLNAEIREVVRVLGPSLAGRRIVLKLDLSSSLPLVAGDSHALHGVVFNLATNAMQAMPDGGELEIVTSPCIDAQGRSRDVFHGARSKEDMVRLTLRDSGSGIAPERLARIFEPFFTTRQHEGGTGLGLAYCQRVVASSGGRIAVESTVGQGTRFVVDLPGWNGGGSGRRSSDGN